MRLESFSKKVGLVSHQYEFLDQARVHSGIAAGPFTRQELEAEGLKEIKINPIQVRLKPNGKARIILDLSSPHFDEEQPPGKRNIRQRCQTQHQCWRYWTK